MSTETDREFQKVVMEGLVPKVEGSAVCVSLVPREGEGGTPDIDAKFCVELGVMIMLDKPILALVRPGSKVPEKLRKVADEVLEWDLETGDEAELMRRINEFTERHVT